MDKIYYSLDSARTARIAVAELKRLGVPDRQISLAARPDIELEKLPEDYSAETSDFEPGLKRGLALGGTTGLVAGLAAAAIPPLGITLAGGALLAIVGAAVGAWASALAGSAVPNDLRRMFEGEIERGRVLLSVDAVDGNRPALERAIESLGPSAVRIDAPPTALA